MFRSRAVEPPAWALEAGGDVADAEGLRRLLRKHYPADMVGELKALLDATGKDLPRHASVRYNPVFGCPPGLEHIGADGNLLVGETLWDLKVSKVNFTRDHIWQLLGYAALDRLHGSRRIATVGLYNPRFRHAWSLGSEAFVRRLGGGSLDGFCEWFRHEPTAHGGAIAASRSASERTDPRVASTGEVRVRRRRAAGAPV